METDPRDIVVIGASAGGLEGLVEIAKALPASFPAAVFMVLHTSAGSAGDLNDILARSGPLAVESPEEDTPVQPGRIYVAPPDRHLVLKPGIVRTPRGPKENGFRPAVDPLFRTAALAYGPRVVGVILSGGLDDGASGLEVIKKHGGFAIVQHPEQALVPNMPLAALRAVSVDLILRIEAIAGALVRLAGKNEGRSMESREEVPRDTAEGLPDVLSSGELPGPPSVFSCPECGGVLFELEEGKTLRFRCHVGHGFTADSLIAAQSGPLEAALWSGLRALEEAAALRRRMAGRMRKVGAEAIAEQYETQSVQYEEEADTIRAVLFNHSGSPEGVATGWSSAEKMGKGHSKTEGKSRN